jgi:hypothetical protein
VRGSEFMGVVVTRLDAAGIPHMVAGSFASAFHGVARTTHDVDVVIDPTPGALGEFLAALPASEF